MIFALPISIYYWMLVIIAGIALSISFINIKNRKSIVAGIIEVDIQSNLCKFHIDSTELSNLKTKKVLFKVVHRSWSFARRTDPIMKGLMST